MVVQDARAGWSLQDVNAAFGPRATCYNACGSSACEGGHEADSLVCTDSAGLSLTGVQTYPGIFVSGAPVLMRATDATATNVFCEQNDSALAYEETLMVVTSDRNAPVQLVALRDASGNEITPHVINERWCETPAIQSLGALCEDDEFLSEVGFTPGRCQSSNDTPAFDAALSDFLAACPDTPPRT